ncbi:hypothetical protein [Nocardiopsis gilva]|uniref:hypothetical protein n=1 Tax=Nocardiopsis gilva TaxID=280236 RepID=UPI0018DF80A3|nr:hypothetical protein [Nocardiopsis gilva]
MADGAPPAGLCPDLNPVEGLWSLVKRGELANLAVTGIDHLARTVRRSLRRLQHRPRFSTACSRTPA